uniref:Uncharacterized protein n=1 Tax=Aegilops tauschii subsp. strangulata TaxID=200361 RepID=A0A453RH94_AEGTS
GEEAVDAAGVLHAPFSDGYDEGVDPRVHDMRSFAARARAVGCETLAGVVARLAERGRPVTCVVYTFFVGWVPEVARASGIPSALFWIQPAAVFAVYYHYFHGHEAVLASCANDPDRDAVVQLPGLPPLKSRALPSVVALTSPEQRGYEVVGTLRDLFLALDDDEHRPKVLVNTLDALEPDALRAVPGFELVAVGPVVPDGSSPSTTDLSLWVSRKVAEVDGAELNGTEAGRGADGGQGIMVEWCDQVRVLSHPAVGCFVTHCGWNSALESIACGVPVVAVPQKFDQPTVAWLVEECAGVGVRAQADGEGVAERGELQRCVETVMGGGETAVEIRPCAAKWMERAREALAGGGTLERNLRAFLSGF